MSTKINIIITEKYIYATYIETICFKINYDNQNEDEMYEKIDEARSVAFSCGLGFGSVILNQINNTNLKTDEDIFKYLKINNK